MQKSSPLPHSGRRIKSNKTDEAKKVGAKKLDSKGFLCSSALRGEVISSVALYKPHQMQQAHHTPHNRLEHGEHHFHIVHNLIQAYKKNSSRFCKVAHTCFQMHHQTTVSCVSSLLSFKEVESLALTIFLYQHTADSPWI